LIAGVVVCIGLSVEETGTLARIRAGIALRLLGPPLLAAATAWAVTQGLMPGVVFAVASAVVVWVAVRDVALLCDLRHGQETRLESIQATGLTLSVRGAPIVIPFDALGGATLAKGDVGRSVLVVTRRDRIQGDSSRLPWVTSNLTSDTLVLSEHQCNLDARTMVERVLQAVALGRKGYR
jgi:hypothetical protein